MNKGNLLIITAILLLLAALSWNINAAHAGPGITNPCPTGQICPEGPGFGTWYANSPAGMRTYLGVTYSTGAPLRKFVDKLPGVGPVGCTLSAPPGTGTCNENNLGQFIPIAAKDTATFGGSDYYHIGLYDYTQQMHSDLPKATKLRGYRDLGVGADGKNHYLGPLIIAQRGQPVRILFENHLGVGTAGDLFIPVDTTTMGAGLGPLGAACGLPWTSPGYYGCNYTQNRSVIHLHGGNTPWISDGTPHQWITPVGEITTPYLKGVSQVNVPDMNGGVEPQGMATYYYPNQQSSRLMFYHDHAYGITRLNVYAGEAAGYLLTDAQEEAMITSGVLPNICPGGGAAACAYRYGIPLVIQDKTFVPWDVAIQDAQWNTGKWGQPGDLWFPHVYEPNQEPNSAEGANPFGRWDYGPWIWPPVLLDAAHSTLPNPSMVPEGFMDTPIVNGTAYPYLPVEPKAYRFRVLNATNDRMLNLQMYVAEPLHISVVDGGSGYQATTVVFSGGGGSGAAAIPIISGGVITGITITSGGSGYATAPAVSFTGGGGTGAIATATITGGIVTGVVVSAGGSGYIPAPAVTLTGGGGTGATAMATVTSGIVSGVTVTNGGVGYSPAPNVVFTGGGGTGAAALATITGGVVTGITIINGGSGYTSAPTVSFAGGGTGTGAAATASITPGVVNGIIVTSPGTGYTSAPAVAIAAPTGLGGITARAVAAVNTEVKMVPASPSTANSALPLCSTVTTMNAAGLAIGAVDPATNLPLNGTGLPANCWPTTWSTDGRDGGVPDPTTAGPAVIQVGNEGGFLPQPVVIPSTPVGYDYNRRSIVVLNVLNKGLYLGPAERADIIVDFSAFAGKNIILYNDAPAPMPGFDPRNDYYTDDPDNSWQGGAPTTLPGYGPNTRTIMRFQVAAAATAPITTANLTALQNPTTGLPNAFNLTQPTPHIPQTTYPAPNNAATDTYARIQDFSLTFTPIASQALWRINITNGGSGYTSPPAVSFTGGGGTGAAATAIVNGGQVTGVTLLSQGTGYTSPPTITFVGVGTGAAAVVNFEPMTIPMQSKAIQELFDPYGRMNATLGVELPFTNTTVQTTIPLGFIDPATETVPEGQVQFWKITHNGVDSHPVHFHLFNVQVINRVGWDGAIRPPEDNEVGWKETVRMHPLEDIIVALQPKTQTGLPFAVPKSVRSQDTTSDPASSITVTNPADGNAIVVSNAPQSFGWEYVWHCHILGHEENDFMRSFVMLVPSAVPAAPTNLTANTSTGNSVLLNWQAGATTPANPDPAIGFRVERCTDLGGGCNNFIPIAKVYSAPGQPLSSITVTNGGSGYIAPPIVTISGGGGGAATATATLTGGVVTAITLNTPGFGFLTAPTVTLSAPPAGGTQATATAVVNFLQTYTDTLVKPGDTYDYQVIAYNVLGDSAASTPVTAAMAAPSPATTLTLTPNVLSPAPAGTAVLFAANATGSALPYQYRFWMNAGAVPNFANAANIVQDYGVGSTWTLPATTLPGTYSVSVDVRTNLSSPTPDLTTTLAYVVAVPVIPPGAGSVRISRPPVPTIITVPAGTLTNAFINALAGDTIQAWGLPFVEPAITFTTAGTVTFSGGFDTTFTLQPSMTIFQGSSLTVAGAGTLVVDRLTIQ